MIKCKWLVEYKNTPSMPYDCERIYDKKGRKVIGDMIHLRNLSDCKNCEYRK